MIVVPKSFQLFKSSQNGSHRQEIPGIDTVIEHAKSLLAESLQRHEFTSLMALWLVELGEIPKL